MREAGNLRIAQWTLILILVLTLSTAAPVALADVPDAPGPGDVATVEDDGSTDSDCGNTTHGRTCWTVTTTGYRVASPHGAAVGAYVVETEQWGNHESESANTWTRDEVAAMADASAHAGGAGADAAATAAVGDRRAFESHDGQPRASEERTVAAGAAADTDAPTTIAPAPGAAHGAAVTIRDESVGDIHRVCVTASTGQGACTPFLPRDAGDLIYGVLLGQSPLP